MPGTLYLIPVPIAEGAIQSIPAEVLSVTAKLGYYYAENARTARRALRLMHPQLPLEPIQIVELDKHGETGTKTLTDWLAAGHDVGVMSEAGCPGVADPGAVLVAAAHKAGAPVKPLTGPSSLLLALMASGLNGQSFSFTGYLPLKEPARTERIRFLENTSRKENATQLLIETPYRNNPLLAELLKTLQPATLLCIACNIGGEGEFIQTKSVLEWRKAIPTLPKAPAVFLLLRKEE